MKKESTNIFNLSKTKYYLFITSIFSLFIFIYSPIINALPVWDDLAFLFGKYGSLANVDNPFMYWQNDSGVTRSFPLSYSIFWVMFKLFGHKYFFYKYTSIIVHIINAVLVERVLRKEKINFPIIGGLIFLLHPLHVETISWTIQLNTTLAFFFFISSLLLFIAFSKNNSKNKYFLSLLFFFLSISIKSVAAPFVILFGVILKKRTTLKTKVIILLLLPHLILITNFGHKFLKGIKVSSVETKKQIAHENLTVIRTTTPQVTDEKIDNVTTEDLNKQLITEDLDDVLVGNLDDLPSVDSLDMTKQLPQLEEKPTTPQKQKEKNNVKNGLEKLIDKYILTSFNFQFYFSSFLFPENQMFMYPKWDLDTPYAIITTLLFTIALMFFITKKIGTFVFSQNIRKSVLFVGLSFLPISGFIYIPYMKFSYVADHWAYFMIAGLTGLLLSTTEHLTKTKRKKYIVTFFLITFIISLTVQTYNYSRLFNNHEKLLKHTIKHNPNQPFLYAYLANIYSSSGRDKAAQHILNKGLSINPNSSAIVIEAIRLNKRKH